MPLLRFADGITLNTGGRYRLIKLDDDWYVVGQGHFAPVRGPKEGKEVWSSLVAARVVNGKLRKDPYGRRPVFGEPDVYNRRQKRPPPIPEYRVHRSDQQWFGYKVYFLQGGEHKDKKSSDSFDVTLQIPYPSKKEAEIVMQSLGDRGKTIKTLMEFLLHTSEFGYAVCPQCEGFGSSDIDAINGCTNCGGLAIIPNL
jgi:hypothetical protein